MAEKGIHYEAQLFYRHLKLLLFLCKKRLISGKFPRELAF